MGIVIECLQVEVGIRRLEVEDVAFPHIGPVFPTDVPPLYEHLVEAVVGSEVDVAAHLLVVGGVAAVGLQLLPVHLIYIYRGQLVGVVPAGLADNHLPPHTAILRGMYPRRVVECAGLVEVEDEVGGKDVAGVIADHDGAPGAMARRLHAALQTGGIGGEVADEGKRLRQRVVRRLGIGGVDITVAFELGGESRGLGVDQLEVHGGIVDAGGLMDIDIQPVLRLHLQRGLHACGRENGH